MRKSSSTGPRIEGRGGTCLDGRFCGLARAAFAATAQTAGCEPGQQGNEHDSGSGPGDGEEL